VVGICLRNGRSTQCGITAFPHASPPFGPAPPALSTGASQKAELCPAGMPQWSLHCPCCPSNHYLRPPCRALPPAGPRRLRQHCAHPRQLHIQVRYCRYCSAVERKADRAAGAGAVKKCSAAQCSAWPVLLLGGAWPAAAASLQQRQPRRQLQRQSPSPPSILPPPLLALPCPGLPCPAYRGHLCITCELLSINLYEYIKASNFKVGDGLNPRGCCSWCAGSFVRVGQPPVFRHLG
jgi:hypothetical protein